MTHITYRTAAAALIVLVMVALVATVRHWMVWGGDDAMYLMNARGIALGQPYGATGYIHNPLNPIHPAAPPPGFPALLAPVYAVWGLDWTAFKLAGLAAFGLFLVVFAAVAREGLPPVWALTAVALIGLHPYTWLSKETIPPEFPFMFFAYAGMWLADRSITDSARIRMLSLLGAGICVGAAYVIRPIGVVLLPAIALASLYQTRKLFSNGVLVVAIACALAWGIEQLLRPDLGTYVGYLQSLGWQSLQKNLKAYLIASRYLLEDHTYARTWRGTALLTALLAAAITGFVVRVRARLSVFEWFTLGYAALLLIYPVSLEPDRYSYPLWPLLLVYALVGCHWLGSRFEGRLREAPAVLLVGLLLMNFAAVYQRIIRHSVEDQAEAAQKTEVYENLKHLLPREAVVIARQPTVIALLTDRRSAIWPARADAQQFRAYMKSIGARYVLEDDDYGREYPRKVDEISSFIAQSRGTLQRVYSHGGFNLYRLAD